MRLVRDHEGVSDAELHCCILIVMVLFSASSRTKVAVSLDESTVERLDRLVKKAAFLSRSQAIQEAVEEKLSRLERTRLARECAKLDPAFEKSMAEEGLSEDVAEWPAY